jgi:hypothetical protein
MLPLSFASIDSFGSVLAVWTTAEPREGPKYCASAENDRYDFRVETLTTEISTSKKRRQPLAKR